MGQVLSNAFGDNIDEEGQDVLQIPSEVLIPGDHVAPFIKLNMGKYTLHPRLRSLTVRQVLEAEDPVREHIIVAEAHFRNWFHRLVIQWKNEFLYSITSRKRDCIAFEHLGI